ncbi:RRP45-like exosomal PH domain-containing protein [Cryptosporidium ubiquitum]|uniref:RRP45-like exosomal PH domain-containing protein n=1 Tax=Cryptosporidium ubiquitum TaxID=857276 RepID=A0A1J4MJC6_9CRYT|nr:RRP45-like exosomal PH domain-containing protein [Cryptosporidium ubiquitum]OII74111.1 RRP45-like exosomal PH domain-containing protein [Cryptosporidium ubiquitum]
MDTFIIGIREYGLRIDGRTRNEYRNISINLNKNYGEAEVNIGRTHVLCIVKSELVIPSQERASEGFISFTVDVGPLSLNPSSHTFRHSRTTMGTEIANYIERILKETGAIDTEILCILSGVCAWSVKCEMHVLFDDGNLFDACLMATLSGLRHYRYTGADIDSFLRKLKCEGFGQRDYQRLENTIKKLEMIPFNIHHFPLSVSIGYIESKEELLYIVDPNSDEESISDAIIRISINDRQEVCGISKFGGVKLSLNQINYAIQIATTHSGNLHHEFKQIFEGEYLKRLKYSDNKEKIIIDKFETKLKESNIEFETKPSLIMQIMPNVEPEISNNGTPNSSILPSLNNLEIKNAEFDEHESRSESKLEKVSLSDRICETLEQVQLDQSVESIELLSAVKSNVKIKKRKKG